MNVVIANSLVSVDPGTIIWTAITLLIFLLALGRFAWKPLLGALEEREKNIQDSLDSAEKALRRAEEISAQNQEALRESEVAAQKIRKEAIQEAELLRNDRIEKAKLEADKLLEQARETIEQEKKKAMGELRKEVASLALQASSAILKRELTREHNEKLVDDVIANLPQN